ncbi:MAG: serine--tRNA ligase [Planctomycetota bacterium]|nr:serine--tRNA ligase [Planctomycetota bacterium]
MIDLKDLRENPDRYRDGAAAKNSAIDIDRVLALDTERRRLQSEQEEARAEQKRIGKESGPQIGRLKGSLKSAEGDDRARIEAEIAELEKRPTALKDRIQMLDAEIGAIDPKFQELLLAIPQPPAPEVPLGKGSDDNVEIRQWHPDGFDPTRPFADQRGFAPRTHLELVDQLGLVDFERGVKMAGSRHYVLTGAGMRLHQAILRYAFDFMTVEQGFTAMSVPVIVKEECMEGTGFFPGGRDQAYHIEESKRGSGHDMYLTGTGEVGLMGRHEDEILAADRLPLTYTTVSTCFRREAGAAGKDTAGLYRIHQFDKVEQVVICRADAAEQKTWHERMIGFVEAILQSLDLPYRLLQCCTGDLGQKNEDMIDVECWMPGRGADGADGRPVGDWGETHSASRLADFQCRRLNLRYRDPDTKKTVFAYSLNNTVAASPRILIPILEIHQQADGSVSIPEPLRPYMGGMDVIRPA